MDIRKVLGVGWAVELNMALQAFVATVGVDGALGASGTTPYVLTES